MRKWKQLVSVLLSFALILSVVCSSAISASAAIWGDVDGDQKITVTDVVKLRGMIMTGEIGEDQIKICDLDSDNAVTVSDVVKLRQMIMNGTVIEIPETPENEEIIDGEIYAIKNVPSGKSVSVRNSGINTRDSIYQWAYAGTASQQWKVVASDSEGYFKLISVATGLVLTIDGEYKNGATIFQDTDVSGDNQLFKFTLAEDGFYTISPKNGDSYAVDVSGSSTADGTKIQLYTSNLSGAQKWYVTKTEESSVAPSKELADEAFYNFIDTFAKEDLKGGLYFDNYNYFWDYAEMMEVLLDKCERNGTAEDLALINKFYKGFINAFGTNWMWNEYNDDIMWMIIFCCRAYNLTGDETYKTQAKTHFDAVYKRAYSTYLGGGLYWKQGNLMTKNSCINSPAAIAACYLYKMFEDETYFNYAQGLFAWELRSLFNTETGQVSDNIHYTDSTFTKSEVDPAVYTYNQGTFIGAATMLYEITEIDEYIVYAKKAADYTMNTRYQGNVINNESSGDDGPGFKGIFARWLGYYIHSTNDGDYNEWLAKNLFVGWNNRNNSGVVLTRWGSRTPDQISARPFSFSTYVALAQAYPYDFVVPEPAE